MTSKVFKAIIMGAPGSGKGTISDRITKKFNIKHLSCGDLLRRHIQQSTMLGIAANKYMQNGQLVPDNLVIDCILDEISNIGQGSWLLDGFPRTIEQANKLGDVQTINSVMNLVVPHDVIIDRVKNRWIHLSSGRVYNIGFNSPKIPFKDDETGEPLVQRDDDKPETVKNRLQIYDNVTKPLVDYYKSKGKLIEFHGRTSDEIWPNVVEYLQERV
ncbi:GTP:AMP phosphotransferase AK3, mitochondrial [Pseudolycoriella hygida]|uniref:GTP:AMP phosphotransferase, mitochondrial n=1 Tax=Pseudolycoriella hygida TaxID=35572 RepID=A0A9Q0NFC0_9DIPT|nr:GTP:AMP phosphotransferase AK3, mitochondrial [Pseudolycoriella hygida]